MHKYKLTIEYDGTAFRGWQTQKNARSIQGTLLEATEKMLGGKADLQGAGRTDAGVHALAQVAHLATTRKLPPRSIREGLNDLLPSGINIRIVEEMPADFHARHHAKVRSYIYVVSRRRTAFGKRYVWWIKEKLDLRAMQAVMELFCGFHDFASFADRRRDKQESTLANIYTAELHDFNDLIVLRFAASHFLWKMVRRMVGITMEAGKGNLSPADVRQMISAPSDIPARFTAPPSGLFLEHVFYEEVQALPPISLPLPPFFPS